MFRVVEKALLKLAVKARRIVRPIFGGELGGREMGMIVEMRSTESKSVFPVGNGTRYQNFLPHRG